MGARSTVAVLMLLGYRRTAKAKFLVSELS